MSNLSNTPFRLGPWSFTLHFGSDIADFDQVTFQEKDSVKATLQFIADHQDELLPEIVAAIRAEYDKAVADRDAFDPEVVDEILPSVNTEGDLIKLVGPRTINIFETAKEGMHYIGLEFDCTWDDEHGIGILVFRNRCVRHGGADVALTEWMARRDAGIGFQS